MAGNLLSIGKSALFAAQAGLSTTGHNISNANVAGYNRQVVVQAAGTAQNIGVGFIGSGTEIAEIKRYSSEFLNSQVRTAQSGASSLDAFHAQISQVDNLLADTTSGLSPALQDFFKGVQDIAGSRASVPSRQALMSSADSLASRFQGIDGRLDEIREGVNAQITSNVTLINSYARQIAQINEEIAGFSHDPGHQPNDLLDTRDQMVAELNKQVKASVIRGDNNSLTVSIGTGQPLVVGKKSFELVAVASPTDITRTQVGFKTGDKVTVLAESALSGGELGGLFEFRAQSLDRAQNALGRIAIGLAATFNDQHRLGQDADGKMGADFFYEATAFVGKNVNNALTSTTAVSARVSDPTKLTQSDYKVAFDGTHYEVTRLSDNKVTTIAPFPQGGVAQTIDGVDFSVSGSASAGDNFVVRPTINGAAQFKLLVTDGARIAAGAPLATSVPLSNKGGMKVSEGKVDDQYLLPGNALSSAVTVSYNKTANALTNFPAGKEVTVTTDGATPTSTTYPAGTASIPYTAGATYAFGGVSVTLTGQPAEGDTFAIEPNVNGVGDTRNAALLGSLQTRNIFDNSSATYQSAYAELVSFVGNKTREVEVNGKASTALLAQARDSQQNVSGVNLDEEATNLLRYQQAYQAAGKVMQIASTLFDTLMSLGR